MGTSLIDLGAPVESCFEELNSSNPALVERVHRGFIDAGARLVLTNTFGGNRYRLERHGLAGDVARLNAEGVEAARRCGPELIAGSMGPLGVRLAPYGRVRPEDAADAYFEQAGALTEAGVDLLAVETQTDLREMEQALAACRAAAPKTAVLVSATFTKDDRTLLGSTPEAVASRLVELGADAIGVNCGEGPAQVLRIVRAMKPYAGGLPLVVRPNAGGPSSVGGRFVYPATPDYVGDLARALLNVGVAVLGGCCGTGPAHTAAIAEVLHERRDSPIQVYETVVVLGAAGAPEEAAITDSPPPAPTGLEAKLSRGDFVVAVEMEPPRSFSAATLVAAAGTLRDAGADVIDVADSPMAKMRMSAWAACRLVQEQVGVETVLHFPTRGRNLLRLQGDLLGAHALGIRNLFVCVGDPVTIGDFPHGSDNVDITATGLIELITEEFNQGRDRAGSSIGEPTAFFVGAAISPASELDREVRLLRKKVEAGASFFLTQPVFEVAALQRLVRAYEDRFAERLEVPLLAGVLPLLSSRHADFLHNEVPGIEISAVARDRLRAAGEGAWREGLAMARELVAGLRSAGMAGIYLVPQLGRYDLAAEVVEAARALDVK
jgi:homocysteine S-methyltransferase